MKLRVVMVDPPKRFKMMPNLGTAKQIKRTTTTRLDLTSTRLMLKPEKFGDLIKTFNLILK